MATKKTKIDYTARDFDSIKLELLQYCKRYYPDTYRDFGEASFGSMTLDMVAYVGDMLSYYLDYQANEMFLDTATEEENVDKISKYLGHKKDTLLGSSTGTADFYVIIPANNLGLGPAEEEMPILSAGASVLSSGGAAYTVVNDIRFDDATNEVVPARIGADGIPTKYAIKASGEIVSGRVVTSKVATGGYEKYKKIKLPSQAVEILSVVDSAGHEYYEVDYLSQNVVYKDVSNRAYAAGTGNATTVMRPFTAVRRFAVETIGNGTFLQFGHGSDSELTQASVVEPSNLVMNMHARNYSTNQSFDPSKLLSTDKFGIAPSDTVLTVKYRVASSNSNAAVGSIKTVDSSRLVFKNPASMSTVAMSEIKSSLEVSNSSPILGSISTPDIEETKRRAQDSFATQSRAVTKQDLESLCYSMPSKYGAIKRCKTSTTTCKKRRNLEIYVLSEDNTGKLITATDTLKQNLKIWLSDRRMMNDAIEIKDAKVVNYGIDFSIMVDPNSNKHQVLNLAFETLKAAVSQPLYIGEPLYISDIYSILNGVTGVVDTRSVKISNKTGTGYSSTSVNMNSILSSDGLTIETPLNVALEIKHPSSDIVGSVS